MWLLLQYHMNPIPLHIHHIWTMKQFCLREVRRLAAHWFLILSGSFCLVHFLSAVTICTEKKRSSGWKFVITGGTVSCRNDNLWCHQWQQSCQIDDLFSMCVPLCLCPYNKVVGCYCIPMQSLHVPCTVCQECRNPMEILLDTLWPKQYGCHFAEKFLWIKYFLFWFKSH